MLVACCTCAQAANPSLAVRADAMQMSCGTRAKKYMCSHCCKAGLSSFDTQSLEFGSLCRANISFRLTWSLLLQVMAETPGMSHQQVQAALSVLMENGHAYTASDEYHYKSTSF